MQHSEARQGWKQKQLRIILCLRQHGQIVQKASYASIITTHCFSFMSGLWSSLRIISCRNYHSPTTWAMQLLFDSSGVTSWTDSTNHVLRQQWQVWMIWFFIKSSHYRFVSRVSRRGARRKRSLTKRKPWATNWFTEASKILWPMIPASLNRFCSLQCRYVAMVSRHGSFIEI